jgi:hypothetical protein
LEEYKVILSEKGFKVAIQLGFGSQIKWYQRLSMKEILTFWLWELMVIQDSKIYFWNYRWQIATQDFYTIVYSEKLK